MINESPQTIADVEQIAAKLGIEIQPDWYSEAYNLAVLRRQQLESELAANDGEKTGLSTVIGKFNAYYPKLLTALLAAGDVLLTMTQTVLIAFGVPGVLLMLLIVEQQRVYHGLQLFEVHDALATLGAVAVVVANLLFELGISWIEHRAGYDEPIRYEFSFRLLAARINYLLGRSTSWKPRPKSPALRWKHVLRVISIAILILALGGSMTEVIRQSNGDWLNAVARIATQSTLIQLVTWVSGFVFAFTAVVTAQALSRYVAERVVEIVAIMSSKVDDKPARIAESAGLSAAMYVYGRLKDTQRTRRQLANASEIPDMGFGGSISIGVPNSTVQPGQTLSPAVEKAAQWLIAHPEHTSVRAAATAAGVSPTTMQSAKKILERRYS